MEFRIGTSSYIIPADIIPNVNYLAKQVRDVELLLFEVDDGPNNLPDGNTLDELIRLANENDLTYTVHLPLDLKLGAEGDVQHVSLVKARKVIDCTQRLDPWAYVLHLDGREVMNEVDPGKLKIWQDQAVRALDIVAEWAGDASKLAVENLEGYPLDFWEPVLERTTTSRCVDVGHLWKDGHDPIPFLERAFARTRVIHMHGIHERDHQSLAYIPAADLDRVVRLLIRRHYQGVLTLEIFSEEDFISSIKALNESIKRIQKELSWDAS